MYFFVFHWDREWNKKEFCVILRMYSCLFPANAAYVRRGFRLVGWIFWLPFLNCLYFVCFLLLLFWCYFLYHFMSLLSRRGGNKYFFILFIFCYIILCFNNLKMFHGNNKIHIYFRKLILPSFMENRERVARNFRFLLGKYCFCEVL